MHLSLTFPVIKRFHTNYYKVHCPPDMMPEEQIDPHKPWTLSSLLLREKAVTYCTVKMVQLEIYG